MGRRKVEIKRIEDKSSRQVTFSKRRSGLIKKARELSVLCDVDIALVIFSNRGRLYEFCSGHNLAEILRRHQSHFEAEGSVSRGVHEAEQLQSKCASFLSSGELLQIVERYLEEPNSEQPSVTDHLQLEEQLNAALIQTRFRKTQLMMERVTALHEKESMLREENELLEKEIAATENNGNRNEVIIGFDNNLANCQMISSPQQATLWLL